mmetsp:Transcript_20705/g.30819  ORF Transcript_20705/g.30819 Transcript_20705/m.30819 type:complete len:88 (+) Transcript_20705:68-331(+)
MESKRRIFPSLKWNRPIEYYLLQHCLNSFEMLQRALYSEFTLRASYFDLVSSIYGSVLAVCNILYFSCLEISTPNENKKEQLYIVLV